MIAQIKKVYIILTRNSRLYFCISDFNLINKK